MGKRLVKTGRRIGSAGYASVAVGQSRSSRSGSPSAPSTSESNPANIQKDLEVVTGSNTVTVGIGQKDGGGYAGQKLEVSAVKDQKAGTAADALAKIKEEVAKKDLSRKKVEQIVRQYAATEDIRKGGTLISSGQSEAGRKLAVSNRTISYISKGSSGSAPSKMMEGKVVAIVPYGTDVNKSGVLKTDLTGVTVVRERELEPLQGAQVFQRQFFGGSSEIVRRFEERTVERTFTVSYGDNVRKFSMRESKIVPGVEYTTGERVGLAERFKRMSKGSPLLAVNYFTEREDSSGASLRISSYSQTVSGALGKSFEPGKFGDATFNIVPLSQFSGAVVEQAKQQRNIEIEKDPFVEYKVVFGGGGPRIGRFLAKGVNEVGAGMIRYTVDFPAGISGIAGEVQKTVRPEELGFDTKYVAREFTETTGPLFVGEAISGLTKVKPNVRKVPNYRQLAKGRKIVASREINVKTKGGEDAILKEFQEVEKGEGLFVAKAPRGASRLYKVKYGQQVKGFNFEDVDYFMLKQKSVVSEVVKGKSVPIAKSSFRGGGEARVEPVMESFRRPVYEYYFKNRGAYGIKEFGFNKVPGAVRSEKVFKVVVSTRGKEVIKLEGSKPVKVDSYFVGESKQVGEKVSTSRGGSFIEYVGRGSKTVIKYEEKGRYGFSQIRFLERQGKGVRRSFTGESVGRYTEIGSMQTRGVDYSFYTAEHYGFYDVGNVYKIPKVSGALDVSKQPVAKFKYFKEKVVEKELDMVFPGGMGSGEGRWTDLSRIMGRQKVGSGQFGALSLALSHKKNISVPVVRYENMAGVLKESLKGESLVYPFEASLISGGAANVKESSVLLSKSKTEVGSKSMINYKVESIVKTKELSKSQISYAVKSEAKTEQREESRQGPITKLDFSQKVEQKTEQIQQPTIRMDNVRTNNIVHFAPIVRPKMEFPKWPSIPRGKKGLRGYNVFVRRKGVFRRENLRPLSFKEALRFGSSRVRGSSAATFKVEESGGEATGKFRGRFRPEQFYRKNELFIEKNIFRIDTSGELKEITFKGNYLNKIGRGFRKLF